ncbi:MAG: hypothetical protein ACOYJG_07895 [Prevotella sp.]|jgi:hypothetical protein
MKKITIGSLLCGLAFLVACPNANAQQRQLRPLFVKAKQSVKASSQQTNKAPRRVGDFKEELINEDFSGFTSGTPDAIDTTELFCQYGRGKNGIEIPSSMTVDAGWTGSEIYSAGGCVAIKSHNYYTQGFLNTPLGDYSGDVYITMRVKPISKVKGDRSYLNIIMMKGGISDGTFADCKDGDYGYTVNFYSDPTQKWTTVTFSCRNYSADNDGFIQFNVTGGLLIDNIKVEISNENFIAAPKILGASNFKKDGSFDLSWEPVRKAYDYRIKLFQKHYTSESNEVIEEDFENLNSDGSGISEGWTLIQHSNDCMTTNEGADGTKGLKLYSGDTLITPIGNSKYQKMKFWASAIYSSDDEKDSDQGYISVDVLDDNGWTSAGWINMNAFAYQPGDLDCEEFFYYTGFKDKYKALRFIIQSDYDDAYLVMDNFNIELGRPYEFVDVTPNSAYGKQCGYVNTFKTTMNTYEIDDDSEDNKQEPFYANLDPEGEYYYQIAGHYLYQETWSKMYAAIGVATPELKPATNMDERGSYTANWEASPKATGYEVTNYGVKRIESDTRNYALLDEDFSKVDANMTSATKPEEAEMLEYTDYYVSDCTQDNGWKGSNNTICQDMLGVAEGYGYVQTPTLYLMNNTTFSLKVKAYGTAGDLLVIATKDGRYTVEFEENEDNDLATGIVNQTITINEQAETPILLYSLNAQAVMFDNIKVSQDVKAGDPIITYLTTDTTSAVKFDYYDLSGYDEYAYRVRAYLEANDEIYYSAPTDLQFVRLDGTNGINGVNGIDNVKTNAAVEGIYTVNGMRLNSVRKGLNIIKYTDGTTKKILVK